MNQIYEELRAALHTVWHRRWLALGVAWGVCLAGWLILALVPNKYESKARILVQLYDPVAEQIGMGEGDRKREVDRVQQMLTSAQNLEKVIRATRLADGVQTPKDMETAVLALAKRISVKSEQANLFAISATSGSGSLSDAENARLAQDVVQKMIDIFREENLGSSRGEVTGTLEFMNQQLVQRQKELESAEQKRLQFDAQNPMLANGGLGVIQRLEASRAELRGIDADLAAAQSALAAINGQLAGTPATLAVSGPQGGAKGALAQAQSDLNAMRARGLTENHPDVIAARNQVAALRSAAAAEGGAGGMPNPAYSSLQSIKAERQANVQALASRRASVQSDIAQITAQQISNPEIAAEQARINRDYDVLKQQYDKLLADREELRLRGSVETERSGARFDVIEPPVLPRTPDAPNRPVLLLAILILGLGAGAGTAFAIGQLRSTFATSAKLERAIRLPVLGTISHTLTEAARADRKRRMKWFYAGSGALAGLFALLLAVEFIQRGMVA